MKMYILFGQRKQEYDSKCPEPLLCWSEFQVDENPKGFHDVVTAAIAKARDDFSSVRMIVVQVNEDKINQIFNEVLRGIAPSDIIEGKITELMY